LSPAQLHALPGAAHAAYVHAFTNSLDTVFTAAAGVAALGFLLALVLPDARLRDTLQAAGPQHSAAPRSDDTLAEIERSLSVLGARDSRRRVYERLAQAAGIDLSPLEAWTLGRIHDRTPGPAEALAQDSDLEPARVAAAAATLERRGLVAPADGWFAATPAGDDLVDRLVHLRRERLAERLADCTPEELAQFAHVLQTLARDLLAEAPRGAERKTAA
jgi:DNA-binding MarR family transcriptional regulator